MWASRLMTFFLVPDSFLFHLCNKILKEVATFFIFLKKGTFLNQYNGELFIALAFSMEKRLIFRTLHSITRCNSWTYLFIFTDKLFDSTVFCLDSLLSLTHCFISAMLPISLCKTTKGNGALWVEFIIQILYKAKALPDSNLRKGILHPISNSRMYVNIPFDMPTNYRETVIWSNIHSLGEPDLRFVLYLFIFYRGKTENKKHEKQ
ncbi:hypothetical protein K501DRAFT_278414 [Backusella circina FSU 941]|nr:hypothetical protein K501DRAFT_278414 [Backusella circina FSU 941]